MAVIVYAALFVLVTVNSAAGNCVGKCYPGRMHQGRLGVAVSDEFSTATSQHSSDVDVYSYYAYDTEGERFYGKGLDVDEDGKGADIEVLALNKEKPPVQYVIYKNGTECLKLKSEMVHVVCVPKEAHYAGAVRLGNDASHITAGVYLSKHIPWDSRAAAGDDDDAVVHVLMDGDCTPVFFAMEGKNPDGGDTVVAFLMSDYEPNVRNASVFQVPDVCK